MARDKKLSDAGRACAATVGSAAVRSAARSIATQPRLFRKRQRAFVGEHEAVWGIVPATLGRALSLPNCVDAVDITSALRVLTVATRGCRLQWRRLAHSRPVYVTLLTPGVGSKGSTD